MFGRSKESTKNEGISVLNKNIDSLQKHLFRYSRLFKHYKLQLRLLLIRQSFRRFFSLLFVALPINVTYKPTMQTKIRISKLIATKYIQGGLIFKLRSQACHLGF